MLQPLAYRMRPRQLEDILGQEHLVGPGKIIHRIISRIDGVTSYSEGDEPNRYVVVDIDSE